MTTELKPQVAPAAAVKAEPVALSRGVSVEDGFRLIVGNCLKQVQDNQRGVAQGADPECIHQMRVGTRRLRSALRLFERWIPFPPALQEELTWLGEQLGAARDADVLADTTLPMLIEGCPQEPDLVPLRQVALSMAGEKRQQAAEAVTSVRYSRLMLALDSWLQGSRFCESLDETARAALQKPLEKRARKTLRRRHEKLLERGKRLARGTPEERHRVRIAAKNTRYAAEFFLPLQPSEQMERYIECLEALQDVLGGMNDAAVADRLLHDIEVRHPEVADSASVAREHLRTATKQDLDGVGALWKQFKSVELGRTSR
ncbi:MAG: CHAD domain-containing protein [Deltaproteobacteria bacterium]|jgi:triphosphatase|nr:CHAD domain-containing protein [Deltaproteobacteria bacterium]